MKAFLIVLALVFVLVANGCGGYGGSKQKYPAGGGTTTTKTTNTGSGY